MCPVGLVLLALGGLDHIDISVACTVLELNGSVNQCIEGVVFAHTHVQARTVHRTALAADDVTGLCKLPTKNLDAESFAFGLATVLRTTYTFFVCHNRYVFLMG